MKIVICHNSKTKFGIKIINKIKIKFLKRLHNIIKNRKEKISDFF